MSTCPENDIHSIYLDNELPENFISEYEKHINSCPKCKKKLEQMRKTHNIFEADSKSLNLDQIFLDQSFERLQSRMRYTKVISESKNVKKIDFTSFKNAIPSIAAAAVILAVMLPINLKYKNQVFKNETSMAFVQPIKRTSSFSIDQNQLLANNSQGIYPISLVSSPNNIKNYEQSLALENYAPIISTENGSPHIHKITNGKLHKHRRRTHRAEYSKLLQDDFFMPEFTQVSETEEVIPVYAQNYVDISSLNK